MIKMDNLNQEEKEHLLKVLYVNISIIPRDKEKLSCVTSVKHIINTVDEIPVHYKSYRYPHIHKVEIQKQINEMLADGIIQHSISPWTSPIWIVPKKLTKRLLTTSIR